MLFVQPKRRPKASSLQRFPFFWDDREKRDFLIAIGNQKVMEEPRRKLERPLTDVEKHIEGVYFKEWKNVGWDSYIRDIYDDVTGRYPARQYDTTSVVALVRFIRNSYSHVNDLSEDTQQLILNRCIFFECFPCLVTGVYKAVEACDEWKSKGDLSQFFQSLTL